MPGYDPNFLQGVRIALPKFSAKLKKSVLEKATLRDKTFADYVNYTVATDKERRAPIFAALNIDQNLMKATKRKDNWRIDPKIGKQYQLDNEYYRDRPGVPNPWDKGHQAMRDNAAWGATKALAQEADDATFFYSNAVLQHQNVNRDEWLGLEQWVGKLDLDLDGRISSFSGPIYGDFSRTVRPPNLEAAEVPAGFFKVVCFVNKETKGLDVRAFIVMQDEASEADRKGRKLYNYQFYQTTVREIEERTGLKFPAAVAKQNPLLYTPSTRRRRTYGISHFPERIEIDLPNEIRAADSERIEYVDEDVDVFIAAAQVNPKGRDTGKEWISLINLETRGVNLGGWYVEAWPTWKRTRPSKPQTLKLNDLLEGKERVLAAGESVVLKPIKPLKLVNTGGTIVLYNRSGGMVDRVSYEKKDTRKPGKAVIFAYRQES
ncbi:MAG: DNA/RNA non-specific endonuclease [candidate division Zixibacteria bacterium]|nr:DNA/RNA non-specific endonuclease [candidate division Zixibacteria bacterium]